MYSIPSLAAPILHSVPPPTPLSPNHMSVLLSMHGMLLRSHTPAALTSSLHLRSLQPPAPTSFSMMMASRSPTAWPIPMRCGRLSGLHLAAGMLLPYQLLTYRPPLALRVTNARPKLACGPAFSQPKEAAAASPLLLAKPWALQQLLFSPPRLPSCQHSANRPFLLRAPHPFAPHPRRNSLRGPQFSPRRTPRTPQLPLSRHAARWKQCLSPPDRLPLPSWATPQWHRRWAAARLPTEVRPRQVGPQLAE